MPCNPIDVSWLIPEDNIITLNFDGSLNCGTRMATGELVLCMGCSLLAIGVTPLVSSLVLVLEAKRQGLWFG